MARIVGLDVGDVRIGVAVSDEDCGFSFPLSAVIRQEGYKRDLAAIRAVVNEYAAVEIVVGLPLMMDGTMGTQADKVQAFVETLRSHFRIPISVQDERLSSAQAHRALSDGSVPRERRKASVDSMAASLILQAYLDRLAVVQGPCASG